MAAAGAAAGIWGWREKAREGLQLSIEGVDPQVAEIVRRAAIKWDGRYGCDRPVKIVPFIGETQKFGQGTVTVVDEAEPGLIKLGQAANIEFAVLHAMNHACQPDNPTLLEKPLPFVDGVIRGFHGLNLMMTTKSGEETKFTFFEEGMAERNASGFPGYKVSDARYFAIGNLTRSKIPFNRYTEAHKWSQNNDIPSFIKAVLDLPSDSKITVIDIQKAMSLYQDVWDQAEKKL